MARRGQVVFEPYSIALEDEVPVNFKVVGTKEWFDIAFESDALEDHEKVIISSKKDLQVVLSNIRKMKIQGIDTETTGPIDRDKSYAMNPVNPDTRLVTFQIGNEDLVWVIQPEFVIYFKDDLESNDYLHLAHNWLYDFKFLLSKYKIHVEQRYCSMLAEQVLSAGLMGRRVGLADCARLYPPHFLISKAIRSLFIGLNGGLMSREMVVYAARDIVLLFPVYRSQIAEAKKKQLVNTLKLEFDVIPCTAEMELGGIYLDKEKLSLYIKYWTARQVEMENEILSIYGSKRKNMGGTNFIVPELVEVFDLASNKDKLAALRNLGVTLNDVKRATLLSIDNPIAKMMGEYSAITKKTSTYGDNLLRKINETTGLWHPRFAQCGAGVTEGGGDGDDTDSTATGRYVSDAQQFPRKQDRYSFEDDQELAGLVIDQFSDVIKQYSKG
jgi:DNA polymerase I-like protein with 3'-5' exonuclease and polymerase domains